MSNAILARIRPSLLLVGFVALATSLSQARQADLAAYDAVYGDVAGRPKGCQVCHFSPDGKGPRNLFGRDYQQAGKNKEGLRAVEQKDSDNDGVINLDEIRTGHFPGMSDDKPAPAEIQKVRGGAAPAPKVAEAQPEKKPGVKATHPVGLHVGAAIALSADKPLKVYDGLLTESEVGAVVGTWGGGTCEETGDRRLGDRDHSLKLEIKGLYEGARLDFARPVEFAGQEQGAYLVLDLSLPQKKVAKGGGMGELGGPGMGEGGMMGMPGGMAGMEGGMMDMPGGMAGTPPMGSGMQGGMMEGGMMEGGMMGPGAMGGPGVMPPAGAGAGPEGTGVGAGGGGVAPKDSAIEHLRVVLLYEQGMRVIPRYRIREECFDAATGWVHLDIPLAEAVSSQNVSGSLRRIALLGDGEGEVYVGQALLALDPDPLDFVIKAGTGAEDEITVRAGEPVDFYLEAKKGRRGLIRYTWDFDDKDGIQEDHVSATPEETVPVTKEQAGTYTLTVTAHDRDQVKENRQQTFKLIVQPNERAAAAGPMIKEAGQ
ncbi:MAG: hypothetical protein AUJ96_21970 [Armatimonadetes bacterium CG2_30_66_41]|nr:MAG: hypothetical protein AUJ96_21970 [Armatimonadetes bacterium CG2_30_66_41]